MSASTPLLLDPHAGRDLLPVEPGELPFLWISGRAEARAADLQHRLRVAHRHLGVPPLDYLIAALAEDHGATILHCNSDFERRAAHTDLRGPTEPVAPLGTLP